MDLFKKLSEASPVSTLLVVAALILVLAGACLGLVQEVVAPLTAEQLAANDITYGAYLIQLGEAIFVLSLVGFIINWIVTESKNQ